METSIFIAKILGLVYIAVGLGMFFSSSYYRKMLEGITKCAGFMYLGGIMALVVGFLIVTYHNVWVGSWVVLITIIGWIALLKGLLLLIFPETMVNLTSVFTKEKNFAIWRFFPLILGLIFGYFGFLA